MSLLSIDVFFRDSCMFCINLKVVLEKLVANGIITFPINYKEASDDESAPYIVKYKKVGNKVVSSTLYGFPHKNKLYNFLELNDEQIESEPVKKHKKLFKIG